MTPSWAKYQATDSDGEVAGQFGVTKQAIWLIKEGRTWKTI